GGALEEAGAGFSRRWLGGRGGQGRAVGPPAGGALTVPWFRLSPAILGSDRPSWAVLVAGVGWAQRTSPLLIGNDQRPPWFGGTDIPSFRSWAHGVFPATVKTGSLSYPGLARRCGGPRRYSSARPGCARTFSA